MFDRFTERARRVMTLAWKEAQKLNYDYIGTEHILLGLVQEGSGVAAQVLKNMDVDLRKVRAEVERLVEKGKNPVSKKQFPFTPRAKRVLDLARKEAQNLGHNCIGTEHLLLGLLRESDGPAAHVMQNLGVRLHAVRDEVKRLLASPGPGGRGIGPERGLVGGGPSPGSHRPVGARLDCLTERAREALRRADEEARRLCNDYIGTEHLLLGLVQGDGIASQVLNRLGLDPATVRSQVERVVERGERPVLDAVLPYTPRVKRILEEHLPFEARRLGHPYLGSEHLLLALLREDEGPAAEVLRSLNVKSDWIREEVVALTGSERAAEVSAGSGDGPAVDAPLPWPQESEDARARVEEILRRRARDLALPCFAEDHGHLEVTCVQGPKGWGFQLRLGHEPDGKELRTEIALWSSRADVLEAHFSETLDLFSKLVASEEAGGGSLTK